MSKSEIEEVFKRDMNDVSENGQWFYRYCRRQIASARRRKQDVAHANARSWKEAREAVSLLTHARNGFRAYVKVDPAPGGENDGRPFVVIDLAPPAGRR